MKNLLLCTIALLSAIFSTAQENNDDPKNISISKASQEYKFVSGDAEHPVQIKQNLKRTYVCNNYRTSIPIVEFYNDLEKIDDVDISVDGSRKHGIKPTYEYYQSDDIFYSDAKVCYFKLPFYNKGSDSKVSIEKTLLDPRYFTSIHFMESQAIATQEIKIIVPAWMKVEFKELNFGKYNINKTSAPSGNDMVYTYTMQNLPAMPRESSSPGLTYYAPHILVMCKTAESKNGKITYFNTLNDQYNWYHALVMDIGNDEKIIKQQAEIIVKGATTEEAKVKAVYQWVQDNIRYLAFEDGIAGFKPAKAQDVLAKKYGDCKGMANLTTELLKSLNIDARRVWIGTKHLSYDYSTPNLGVDNHMISVWMKNGNPVYLDATEKYIGYGEVAERIQGRQTMIEDGNKFILGKVPLANYQQNTVHEKRMLSVDGTNLKGHISQSWKGENKEWLLGSINNLKQNKQETSLKNYLSAGQSNFEITDLKVANLNDYNQDLSVEYDLNWKNVISEFNQERYLELDNRKNLENFKIDTAKRKLPYWFNFKNHLVFETEVKLPENTKAETLPNAVNITRPGYSFKGSYTSAANKLNYKCEIILKDSELNTADFSQWNKDVDELGKFYNQQVVLIKTK